MKVAFIGHRIVEDREKLKTHLETIIEELIVKESADTFLFGSKGMFNALCYEVVSALKIKYTSIRRIYVRAEYEHIDSAYTKYLLTFFEDTFYPMQVHGAGTVSYIKRNQVMIDMSDILVVYYDTEYVSTAQRHSGTKIAVAYANKKNKRIVYMKKDGL